jgi:tetratricopeptide (TPR) repeat protein
MTARPRAFLLLIAGTAAALAQHDHEAGPALPARFNRPMPLYPKALGTFERPISSPNREAQAYFNQGFQLMYAFDQEGAVRSFREAEKRDPECAICYWAEAWSWGSYLNGPMQPSNAPYAYAAIQKAVELAPKHASPMERAFIRAMSVRYVRNWDPAKRREYDAAYAEAARKLYEEFPKDPDAGTLYGEALFVMEPRRGWRDIQAPNVRRIAEVFESVLKVTPNHVGACHLYIHLTEATTQPGRAEPCADSIGNAVPGASHLNHMPSHTWNQLGRWGDSVRANLDAVHSDQKAAIGEGFAIYPPHNLHMLMFAASFDGQGAIAMQAARDYGKQARSRMYEVLTLIRFGRFDEVLELQGRPTGDDIETGVWDFGQGYAQLRGGKRDAARENLKKLEHTAASSSDHFRMHSAKDLLSTLAGILDGEIHRAEGDLPKAIAALERGVAAESRMIYDEPEALPFSARHWLGAALLEAKRPADAEAVYRDDLKRHPNNGWALIGLREALAAQGKATAAADQDFQQSWARSDTWIRASRF